MGSPDFSDGPTVFGSFAGAWHLSDSVDARGDGLMRDASPNAAHGIGHIAPENRQGLVGIGAGFQGAEYIRVPGTDGLRPDRFLTLTAWVNVIGDSSSVETLLSLGDSYGILTTADGTEFFIYTSSNGQIDSAKWESCATSVSDLLNTGWHHLAGVYDGTTLHLYIDGREKASFKVDKDIFYPPGEEFRMGTHGSDFLKYLTGGLDEVRVYGQARSPDWIKLEYETQRPGSTFLEFK
jgi:hypothetical protein